MGKCFTCEYWIQHEGSLEERFFGDCTCPKIAQIPPGGRLIDINGAGYQAEGVKDFKFISGKYFSCGHHKHIWPCNRATYSGPRKSKVPYVNITLTNKTHKSKHVVRTIDGTLSHAQVYSTRRDLCWPNDSQCTCGGDVAGCIPQQVELVEEAKNVKNNRYRILKRYLKKVAK